MLVVPLTQFQPPPPGTAVALGFFDGVHRGHQRIISSLLRTAETSSLLPILFTFRNHATSVLRPAEAPMLLTLFEEKTRLLEACGLHAVVWIDFDKDFSQLSDQHFVDQVVRTQLGGRAVVCGPNYRFGHGAVGTPQTLRQLGTELGITTEVTPAVYDPQGMISSTRIRALVEQGEVTAAAALLGHEYGLLTRVERGEGRGKPLGFPTANLHQPVGKLLPANGVYACRIRLGDRWCGAVSNLGVRPTFNERRRVLEAHIFDWHEDLYGHEVEVTFVERVRDERKFSTPQELISQIRLDVEQAKRILNQRQ